MSYAQNAEDIRLLRVFECVEQGFYVDIGAADPEIGSVTKLFYDRGWSGINIEPGPAFSKLEQQRNRDLNLNVAVGERDEIINFFVTYPDTGMSTTDLSTHHHVPATVSEVRRLQVRARPLNDILDELAQGREIHFLKIDIEGGELAAIRSIDLKVHRPIVIVVESVASWSRTPTHAAWESYLTDAGYILCAFDGVNRFYVRSEDAALGDVLSYPISPQDKYTVYSPSEKTAIARAQQSEARCQALEEKLLKAEQRAILLEHACGALQGELSTIRNSAAWSAIEFLQPFAPRAYRTTKRIQKRYLRKIEIPQAWGIDIRPPGKVRAFKRQIKGWLSFLDKRRAKPLSRRKQVLAKLGAVAEALGDPQRVLEPEYRQKLSLAISATDRHSEACLREKHYSQAMRSALLEAEFVSCLATSASNSRGLEADAAKGRPNIVVDARCLQDPNYLGRGVGAHASFVLRALSESKAPGCRVILLLDPERPDPSPEIRQLGDDTIYCAAALDLRTVETLVSLSPMTASVGPLVPFLIDRTITKVAIVYDFIPRHFPNLYLAQLSSLIEYRARLCALQCYSVFLPISRATAQELKEVFPDIPASLVHVTGVAIPWEFDSAPTEASEPVAVGRRYILAPTGGDPRKNLLSVIAAEGTRRGRGQPAMPVVIVGRLSGSHRAAATKFARSVGLADDELTFLEGIPSARLAELYRQAAVCVVPSHAEGFSMPVAEAVTLGTPVVASDTPAHRDLLGSGWWLVRSRNVPALASAIQQALRSRTQTSSLQRELIRDIAKPQAVYSRLIAGLQLRPPRMETSPSKTACEPGPRRPRIAVATPWPPQRSGIADHSRQLLEALAVSADVTALINFDEVSGSHISTRRISASAFLDRTYDHVISVMGNSHFHLPAVEYVTALGGPIIAHDTRMVEFYLFMNGADWLARLMSAPGADIVAADIPAYLADMDRLPNLAYRILARVGSPMLVHSKQIAARIERETGMPATALPFVPYNLPKDADVAREHRQEVRRRIGLADGVIHVGTFGHVDIRTKGVDALIEGIAWLVSWGHKVKLHIAGYPADGLREALQSAADANGTGDLILFHDRLDTEGYKDMLLAVDVAVQLRTSRLANLSGALMDCIAYGVVTVATRSMKEEISAPDYVFPLPDRFSPLLLAERILHADAWRREKLDVVDDLRRRFVGEKSMEAYAASLLHVLDHRKAR